MPDPVVRWRYVLAILIGMVGVLLDDGSARASVPDDVSSCTTQTDRPGGDIIVPTSVFEGSPLGITIVEGETLCLTGQVEGSALASKVWLADPAQNEPTLIMLQMDPAGPTRALHVRTSSGRSLSFDVAWVNDEGRARFFRVLHVPPNGRSFEAPDVAALEHVPELLALEIDGHEAHPSLWHHLPRRASSGSSASFMASKACAICVLAVTVIGPRRFTEGPR